jgi:hypothetical protein
MREILFRGKRVDNGEWVEGSLIITTSVKEKTYIVDRCYCYNGYVNKDGYADFDRLNAYEVIPETIGQYTGLTNKNGKKIFEGDIVECFSSDYAGRPKIDTIKVKDMTDYNTMVYLNCSNELEIIGNIQDSPKPFKGGADNV